MALTFGCVLSQAIFGPTAGPAAVQVLAQNAEKLGFDVVWLADPMVIPCHIGSSHAAESDRGSASHSAQPSYEPAAVLHFVAGCTRRIRVGMHILIVPYRHPVLQDGMLAALDALSGGRLIIQVSGVDFQGKRMQRPPLPIWIGGHSGPALRRVALLGDGWMPLGLRPQSLLQPSEMTEKITHLRMLLRRASRDEDAVTISFTAPIVVTETPASPRPLLHGSPEAIAADLRQYELLGVQAFNINLPGFTVSEQAEAMDQFAHEVAPLLS
jgi:alkanesulfonate monooxygenase SsuD/methylene tetrahydromethanopterin reductase-like flavin-dependent oxidoreductase (luciferase family)